jgi:hypothetical protein
MERISRASLAQVALDAIEDASTIGTAFEVAE